VWARPFRGCFVVAEECGQVGELIVKVLVRGEGVEVVGVQLVDLVRGEAPAAGYFSRGGGFVVGDGAVLQGAVEDFEVDVASGVAGPDGPGAGDEADEPEGVFDATVPTRVGVGAWWWFPRQPFVGGFSLA
jgi:hypothetical protein